MIKIVKKVVQLLMLCTFGLFATQSQATSRKTQNHEKEFTIKGKIKGLTNEEGGYALFGDQYPNGYKRVKVNMNKGKLSYKGTTETPTVIKLSFRNKNLSKTTTGGGYIPTNATTLMCVIYPGAQIKVSGKITDFIDAYPIDGGENDILKELNSKLHPVLNKSVNISLEIDKNKELTAKEVATLKKTQEELGTQAQNIRVEFLKKHASSVAGLWLMEDMLVRSQIKIEEVEVYLKGVDAKKYGELSYYKALKDRVKGYNSTKIGNVLNFKTKATLSGETFDIKDLRGKYVILDFWGTWCGACVKGMPGLMEFRNAHKDKVEVIAVNCGDSDERWRKSKFTTDYNWIHVKSDKGDNNLANKFNVQGYPTKIIVDPNGKIIKRHVGETPGFYEELMELMGLETAAKGEKFTIKATIEGLNSTEGSYYFEQKGKERGNWVKFPMQGNKVEYTGEVSEPTLIYLNFTDNRVKKYSNPYKTGYFMSQVSLLGFVAMPNKTITANGNATDYIEAYPAGDRENDLLAELNKQVHPLLNKVMNHSCKLGDRSLSDEDKKKIGKEINALNAKISEIKLQFVKENISSIIGLYTATGLLDNKITIDEAPSYFNKISSEYKNSMYYTKLMKRYNQLLEEKKNQANTAEGKDAPEIVTSETYSGNEFTLRSLRGKYVLIDFWGTWCGACIKGMPEMKAFHEKHANKLELLGIAAEKGGTDRWKSMIKNRGFNWHQILNGKDDKDFVKKFGVSAFPTKILVSPEGKIVLRYVGEDAEFYKKLYTLLK
ncbi:TlpA disulfide reductase family protein [Marinifilum fragile]|uniref:TlpA family protein disulfide reductase n=1 Tax=Marinifilum fragile TaxID=570161 RepID=UPI002AA7AABC|nr:TlpA disulfide reductase family protein [Marinifilum fragile]